jgi:hypothetical protein
VADFIDWTSKANKDGRRPSRGCDIAFRALELIDQGLIREADLKALRRIRASSGPTCTARSSPAR